MAENAENRAARLAEHVHFFAADSLNGRAAGTADAAKARAYIIRQYQEIGLQAFIGESLEVPFTNFANVVGFIPGNDPELSKELIVLGAHYDHLGIKNGQVYNGADDNASGSAALIEVARQLMACKEQLKRSVVIAAFDAEELGLFGSIDLSRKIDAMEDYKVALMMSLDMVGWYRQSGLLHLEGVGTVENGRQLFAGEAEKYGIKLKFKNFEDSVLTATDTEGFAKMNVPTIAVTTGLKSPYHKPGDDAELIDYEGLEKISEFITSVTLQAAKDPGFKGSGKLAVKHGGKLPFLEFGITAGIGSSNIKISNVGFDCKSSSSYEAGIKANFNLSRYFALMTGASYGLYSSLYPDEIETFSKTWEYSQTAVTVPLMLACQSNGLYFGIGSYYSHILGSSFRMGNTASSIHEIEPNQYGIQLGFGIQIGHISMDFTLRKQMNSLFMDASAPKAYMKNGIFSIGYMF